MAHSADGFIARAGERTNLNNEASWQRVYAGREKADAVMIGINTVLIDDPGLKQSQIRIVVDTHGRLAGKLARGDTWVLSAQTSTSGKTITCPTKNGQVDLPAALEKLYALGIKSILCEGGAKLAQSLNDERLIDELILIECPVMLGSGVMLPVFSGYKPVREENIAGDIWRYYKRA